MARTDGIGIQNFDEIMEANYFYIDKTHFIKEWWNLWTRQKMRLYLLLKERKF